MKDFPIFDTEYGVASLILKEVPYRQEAYVIIRDVQPGQLEALLAECRGFCRMVGAEKIYASGHGELEQYPLHTAILEMRGAAREEESLSASVFPVTDATVARWREIYNRKMRAVDNGATLEARDEAKLLSSPGACFVHEAGTLLGIFWLEENKLLALASAAPGGGRRVMHTLFSLREGQTITLEVASTNEKARKLYESLGFLPVREVSRWYRI